MQSLWLWVSAAFLTIFVFVASTQNYLFANTPPDNIQDTDSGEHSQSTGARKPNPILKFWLDPEMQDEVMSKLVDMTRMLAPSGTRVLIDKLQNPRVPSVIALAESGGIEPPVVSKKYRIALALFRGSGVTVLSFLGLSGTQSFEVAMVGAIVSGSMSALLQYHNIPFVNWLLTGKLPEKMGQNRVVSSVNSVISGMGKRLARISPIRKAEMPFYNRWTLTEVGYLSIVSGTLEGLKYFSGLPGVESLSTFQNYVINHLGLSIPAPLIGIAENSVMGILSQGILDNANSSYYEYKRDAFFKKARSDPDLVDHSPQDLMKLPEFQKIMFYTDIRTTLISSVSMAFVLANMVGVPYADLSLLIMTGLGIGAKYLVGRSSKRQIHEQDLLSQHQVCSR
jgi:hypothetical protein